MGASFQIGRSALAAYQAALQIVGQNIANLGNPNYARQTGRLIALQGQTGLNGGEGAGVRLDRIQRHVDEALEARLRSALAARSGATVTYDALASVEGLYNELTDQDLSTQLTSFFASFADLQTTPDDSTARNLVISAADGISRTLRRQRSGLMQQMQDLNSKVVAAADNANSLAGEIADLNEQIVQQEAGGQVASALRDRRDGALRDLAGLMDIQVREQTGGSVNVYVGGEPLIEFNHSRGLTTDTVMRDGHEVAQLRFADNHGSVIVRDGELAGILAARDTHLADQVQRLDQLAVGLIYELNRVQSTGAGLVGYSSINGTYAVKDASAALNSPAAGLALPVQNGTFIVHVRDKESGQVITRQIQVDLDGLNGDDTSLNSLAAALGQVPGVTASVTGDQRLSVQAGAGQEIWFSEDSSGALAALGVGTFFQGVNAADIDLTAALRQDNRLIAASASGAPGDGTNAGLFARLGEKASALLGDQTITDFHATTINGLAVSTAAAQTSADAADAVYSSLMAQREAISGVSVDEEAINLTQYEKAFEGASRYLSVIDNLSTEILNLVS
jgi:flagellar hook-associated protein 1